MVKFRMVHIQMYPTTVYFKVTICIINDVWVMNKAHIIPPLCTIKPLFDMKRKMLESVRHLEPVGGNVSSIKILK